MCRFLPGDRRVTLIVVAHPNNPTPRAPSSSPFEPFPRLFLGDVFSRVSGSIKFDRVERPSQVPHAATWDHLFPSICITFNLLLIEAKDTCLVRFYGTRSNIGHSLMTTINIRRLALSEMEGKNWDHRTSAVVLAFFSHSITFKFVLKANKTYFARRHFGFRRSSGLLKGFPWLWLINSPLKWLNWLVISGWTYFSSYARQAYSWRVTWRAAQKCICNEVMIDALCALPMPRRNGLE